MLDEAGIEELSMRKLGARLNAGATSLYRHVATKDELMELAVDEVFREIAVPGTVARSGQTEAEFVASLMPAAQQAAAGHEHLAWSAAVAAAEDPAELREARFRSGLDVVLDGLALRLRS
jgi:AcrR family transcriptional regulator